MAVIRYLISAFMDVIRPNKQAKIDAQKFVFTDLQIELGDGNIIRYSTDDSEYQVWLNSEWKAFPGGDVEQWREPTHTGVIRGGLLSIESPTEVRIASGEGWIINSYNPVYVDNPQVLSVAWEEQVVTTNVLGEIGFSAIYINSSGSAFVVPAGSPTIKRENIGVGVAWYTEGGIDELLDIPSLVNNTGYDFRDYIAYTPLEQRVKGAEINPVTNEIQVWANAGEIFILGSNYKYDNRNPNISPVPQYGDENTPLTFDVILSDGTIHETAITDIPEYYDDGDGTVSNLGNNRATVFYLYRILGGHFYLQPSQIQYDSGEEARGNLVSDYADFTPNPYSVYMIPSCQIWREEGANDFDNFDEAGINNGFGGNATGGSSGEGSTDYVNAGTFDGASGVLQLTGVGLAGASVNMGTPLKADMLVTEYDGTESMRIPRLYDSDLDAIDGTGFYQIPSSATNKPGTLAGMLMQIEQLAQPLGNFGTQIFYQTDGLIYKRTEADGIWGSWASTDELVAYIEDDQPGFIYEKIIGGANIAMQSEVIEAGNVAMKINVFNVPDTTDSPNQLNHQWLGTQAQYDGLTPDADTIYFIQE